MQAAGELYFAPARGLAQLAQSAGVTIKCKQSNRHPEMAVRIRQPHNQKQKKIYGNSGGLTMSITITAPVMVGVAVLLLAVIAFVIIDDAIKHKEK